MAKEHEETHRHGALTPARTRRLMVLVALATAIAIWLVPVDEEPVSPSLPPLPSARDIATGEPATELRLPPPTGGIAAVINGGDRARAFLAGLRSGDTPPDPEVVFAEAERLQGEGNLEDAYLLYRYAARHGQSQAALLLGTQADPAYHDAETSYLPEPEPGQAYKWYGMAAAAGNEEAAQRMQVLQQRVQQDAAAGDEQARRLLLQWR